jgi:enoyl-CoA hydratase
MSNNHEHHHPTLDELLVVAEQKGRVGIARLNRPDILNALSTPLVEELVRLLEAFDKEPSIGCIIITGSERAFAAGADIRHMANATADEMRSQDFLALWDRVYAIEKPIIACVQGFCLGGGMEISMMCDMIVAADNARFGQPEINIGVIPGAGGTQRLTRLVGKPLAMEMILTGRPISAEEAFRVGLVNRIAPASEVDAEALALAREIAAKPAIAVKQAKDAIKQVYESTLDNGLMYERQLFYGLFDTYDQKEGMAAFLEKRPAEFKHK